MGIPGMCSLWVVWQGYSLGTYKSHSNLGQQWELDGTLYNESEKIKEYKQ